MPAHRPILCEEVGVENMPGRLEKSGRGSTAYHHLPLHVMPDLLRQPRWCSGLGERGLRNRRRWQEFYCPLRRGSAGGRGGRAHSLEEWIDVETESPLSGMRASLATILAIAEMDTADEPPAGRET